MRVAVVGAGISGLVAHLLYRQHEITVFEAGDRLVASGRRVVRFRRADYLDDPALPLDQAIRDLVELRTGRRPGGPIRMLAHLRSFGHCFNPVSLYYCFEPEGERVETLIAEVTNTPWGERHAYVVPHGVGRFTKALHVSRSLRRLTLRYPLATIRVLVLIYLHALGPRLAGAKPSPHPRMAHL